MRIGIVGYGNIGRSIEMLAVRDESIEIAGVFTRRNCDEVKTLTGKTFPFMSVAEYKGMIDVLCLCHGSSVDLPLFAPEILEDFNTVDSFDNHKEIENYRNSMDIVAKRSSTTALVSIGWDPGFLSLMRLYSSSFLPNSSVNTFWGRGVSQGHSEALKKINGVKKAIQYTVPREEALTLASLVSHPLSNSDRHRRVCYIVAEKGKEDLIASEVLTMENYFVGYQTEIHFISDEEFDANHTKHHHRGRIYALGSSGKYNEIKHSVYFNLDIGSNPDLTAAIMLSGARAVHKMHLEKRYGAYSVFDVPPSYFLPAQNGKNGDYL